MKVLADTNNILMNETMSDELSRLRAENARLRVLLACHGIAADEPEPTP